MTNLKHGAITQKMSGGVNLLLFGSLWKHIPNANSSTQTILDSLDQWLSTF